MAVSRVNGGTGGRAELTSPSPQDPMLDVFKSFIDLLFGRHSLFQTLSRRLHSDGSLPKRGLCQSADSHVDWPTRRPVARDCFSFPRRIRAIGRLAHAS